VLLLGAAVAGASPVNPSPDPTWQTNGRVRTVVYAGGVAYIGGEFTQLSPPSGGSGSPVVRNHVAAISETTGQVLPWNPNADGTVWALAVSGSTVYLGGDFANVGGQSRPHAAAVDASTGAVSGWNPAPDGGVKALAVDSSGDVYLGGNFTHLGTKTRNRIAEVTASGTTTSWNPAVKQVTGDTCPPRCSPFVASIALSSDGSAVYFGGHFGLVNGIGRNNAAAVSVADGSTLPWNPDVFGTGQGKNPNQANKIWDVELGPSSAYVCGDFWSLDGFQRHPNLAAVDLTNGHLLPGFDATTDGNTPACELVGGYLFIGGHYQHVGPNSSWVFVTGQKATLTGPGSAVRTHLAAVDAATGAIDPWNPGMDSVLGVHSLSFSGTHLGVGGDFTRIGGAAQEGYAQFALDTTPPDTVLDSSPANPTNSTVATFAFHSTEKNSTFACSLDGVAASACTSPTSYSGLANGAHTFTVAATDQAGNTDPTPASFSWTVDTQAPGAPTGLGATLVAPNRVALSWTAPGDLDVAFYRVYRNGTLIGQTPDTGTSYADTTVFGPVTYSYTVRAVDLAGNVSTDSGAANVTVPAGSPPFFADGFESGNLSNWTSSTGLVVQSQFVYSGSFAARATSGSSGTYARELVSPTQSELYYAIHFDALALGTKATLLRFLTSNGSGIASLYLSSAGKVSYKNDKTGATVTSSTVASLGTWHSAEVRVKVNGTASEIEVWLDGVRLTDLARTESFGATAVGQIQLGEDATGRSYDIALDAVAAGTSYITG
jgi:hypothetical protein